MDEEKEENNLSEDVVEMESVVKEENSDDLVTPQMADNESIFLLKRVGF